MWRMSLRSSPNTKKMKTIEERELIQRTETMEPTLR
jgi:hypothetical protein